MVESLAHARYIIVWAMNMLNTEPACLAFILEAKEGRQE